MVLLIAFILGAFLGSFLCVLVDRLPRGEQVIKGRSYCEYCKHVLHPVDLIPVISFLSTGGKCRYCKHKIPPHLLIVEISSGLITGLLFLFSIVAGIGMGEYLLLLATFLAFYGIFLSDLRTGIIPDEFNVAVAVFTLLSLIFFHGDNVVAHVGVGLITFAFFLILFLGTRGRGMGFGDVKLAFILGFFLGFPKIVVCLYAAFLTATAISLILIVLGKKKFSGGTIYFGPFLVAGCAFAYFFGDSVISLFFR